MGRMANTKKVECKCGAPMDFKVKADGGVAFPPTLVCTVQGCTGKQKRKERSSGQRASTGASLKRLQA